MPKLIGDNPYQDAPRQFWHPGYDKQEEYSDTIVTGLFWARDGLSSCYENYHGTLLIPCNGPNYPFEPNIWKVHLDGFNDDHPDISCLLRRKDWWDRLINPRDEDFQTLLADLLLYVEEKGWIEMVWCYDKEDYARYWRPKHE